VNADIHVQLRPGTDAVLFAGLLRVILGEHLHDYEFCARWVNGLEALRAEIDWATPEEVGRICDVAPELVVETARVFAGARKGQARSGTGPDMGPHANAAEHLIQAMNVVCGRYARAGDCVTGTNVLGGPSRAKAQAGSPMRF
jgi:anaerobic selenocysteine-containing dehydrogenase